MRLGIDAYGLQILSGAERAPIRRVVELLIDSLPQHSIFIYLHRDLPPLMPFANAEIRLSEAVPPRASTPLKTIQTISDENPDQLDCLLIAAPLAPSLYYRPPQIPTSRLTLAALVHGSPRTQTMAAMLSRYDLLIEHRPVEWPEANAAHASRVLQWPRMEEASSVQRIADLLVETKRVSRAERRRRIAFFSPLPPNPSGIADYSVALIEHLGKRYAIDLFYQAGFIPTAATAMPAFGVYEHTMFPSLDAAYRYDALVYQMGNSHFHDYIYQSMMQRPGIVCLHDFGIGGYQSWRSGQPATPADYLPTEIQLFAGNAAPSIIESLDDWSREPDGLRKAFSERRLYLNRRVFDRSQAVIVHDDWCRREVARLFPEMLDRVFVVPSGTTVRAAKPGQRREIRQRFGLPPEAIIFASFGIMHPEKLNDETIAAFTSICHIMPDALLVFVGRDLARGQAARQAMALGVQDRVRFLGHVEQEAFAELAACVDIGINLRRAPTNGETSASLLNLLSSGVPCIVSDVDTFSSYPDDIVCKVPEDEHLIANLAATMLRLAGDSAERRARGEASAKYIGGHHSWEIAARGYAAVIDRTARRTDISAAS